MIPSLPNISTLFNFPSRDIDPKTKDGKYCLRNAQAIYSLFLKGKTAWTLTNMNKFGVLRSYAQGTQDVNQYKSFLNGESTEGGTVVTSFDDTALSRISKKEGWGNILWENISPAPQILSVIHGMFDKLDYDCYVDTIDSNSKALKEEQKYIKLCEAQNANWQIEYKKNAGIPVDEEVVFPKSAEELAMFEAKDGFKLNVARAMQKLVRHSFNISDWDGTVRKKVINDLLTIKYGAVRDIYDAEDHKWKTRYLDPSMLVIQFSTETDYKDSEYAGYFKLWTISNLRNKLPDVPESEWNALAKVCYSLYGNNPNGNLWEHFSDLDPSTRMYRYDGFNVPVFECEWIDTDTEKKIYYTSVRGRDSIIDIGFDSAVKPLKPEQKEAGANQEVKSIFKRVVRQAFWVLNTDYVFDYGIVKMAAREGLSKPQLSFHVEQLLQTSLVERMKPILDQIAMQFLRWQNSLANMIERGVAINTSMLANVTMGGKKLSPADVIKLYRRNGVLLYSYGNTPTGLYSGGAATPITQTEGGLGTRVQEAMQAMTMEFMRLKVVTGIDILQLDATGVPVDSKDTPQVQIQPSPAVINPVLHSLYEIKGSVGTSMMRRIQIGIRNSDKIREAYTGVIAPNDMDAIVLMEADGVQYGMELKPKPDAKMKAMFENWINIALQNTREQRPGADLPDVMYFMTQLEQGADMYDLIEQLSYVINKAKQESLKNSQDAIKLQAQTNAEAKQMEIQGQMAKDNNMNEGKIKEEAMRGNVKDSLLTKQFNMDMLKQLQQASDAEKGLVIPSPSHK
jgi:hypothetical protein